MEKMDAIAAPAVAAERKAVHPLPVAGVSVRPFPWPYRAMLAICSDIDATTPASFATLHRFLNTTEHTPLGRGLGLDVADSFWFYALPGSAADPADQQVSYFAGLDWQRLSPFAEQILDYIRGGWIDTMHSYGNFSVLPAGHSGFTREHAERALAVLGEAGLTVPVWVNHGNRKNVQNIGTANWMVGDLPRSPRQHSHLLYRHGMRFLWSGPVAAEFQREAAIAADSMRDGRKIWRFWRQDFAYREDADELARRLGAVTGSHAGRRIAMVWHPRLLHLQLTPENLAELVGAGGYAILGQHLGVASPGELLSPDAIEALHRLKAEQDAGSILVARTSRLLEYACSRDHLQFEVKSEADGKTVIDIIGTDDPVRGRQAPLLRRLRGITFEVPGESPVELRFRGYPLAADDILTHRMPGRQIIGVKWFPPDHNDYVQERRNYVGAAAVPMGASQLTADAEIATKLTARIVEWLSGDDPACPEQVEEKRYRYVLNYAKARYAVGLDHYRRLFGELGWTGKRRGLDIGSGAGHWTLAFALDNGHATGIDTGDIFVRLANGAAAQAELAARVSHLVGRAEHLPFPDDSFDVVWSHSVLMYSDVEDAIGEVARVLKPQGQFYCGYSSIGFRLGGIYSGILSGRKDYLRSQLYNYIGGMLQRDGVARAPWSNIRFATRDELVTICRLFGLRTIGHPGLQDGRKEFAGIPATIDLLCVRDGDATAFRNAPLTLSPADDAGRRRCREMIRLGLGKKVQRALDEHGNLADSDVRSLYVLTAIRAGRSADVLKLVRQGVDPLVRGIHALDCRGIEEAIAAFSELPTDSNDRAFLLGVALLAAARSEAALREFEHGVAAGRRPVECGFGAILARLDSAEPRELAQRMAAVLSLLPAQLGAADADIAEMIDHLGGRGGA